MRERSLNRKMKSQQLFSIAKGSMQTLCYVMFVSIEMSSCDITLSLDRVY